MEDGSPRNSKRKDPAESPGRSYRPLICDFGGSCLLRPLDGGGAPLRSRLAGLPHGFVRLGSNRVYTIGRHVKDGCDVGFRGGGHRCVSRRHCQLLVDGSRRKLLLVDGFFRPSQSNLIKARTRLRSRFSPIGRQQGLGARPSLNGIFINGCRLQSGVVTELSVGDKVSFGCPSWVDHGFKVTYGFVVESVEFGEQSARIDADYVFDVEKKGLCPALVHWRLGHGEAIRRAVSLLTLCRCIIESPDPVRYISENLGFINVNKFFVFGMSAEHNALAAAQCVGTKETCGAVNSMGLNGFQSCTSSHHRIFSRIFTKDTAENVGSNVIAASLPRTSINNEGDQNICQQQPDAEHVLPSDGKFLFLNRLEFLDKDQSDQYNMVSLPELFHPIGSLMRVFIATFTSDISWFLSCCDLPNHLPITIACHHAEKCWSTSADKRTSTPCSDYPNLVLIHPPFPDVIAFGRDRKKRGVGCHHPKLIIFQREDSIRIVITSANLVSRQWNNITNTVWWQDFPRRIAPDYLALFTHLSSRRAEDPISDFAAQLAGFVSSLIIDICEQAYWVGELAKYDFGGAAGHLIASIPGIHLQDSSCFAETAHWMTAGDTTHSQSNSAKLLGSVQTSVVGISHLFRTAADMNGIQLKALASLLGNCPQNSFGMTEVLLKRNTSVPADVNAISVLVTNSGGLSDGDSVQLGFLPRNIAKWVSPLSDAGFFRFSACIFPKEAIAAALGGCSTRVQLILYVSQGPNFFEISHLIQPGHLAPLCSLLASIERSVGLWRLKEVLGRYRWPESLETDFVYGSSSIGTSVNPQFLAAFSAAAGKRSYQFSESEESDPEWDCWTVNHELRNPSMKIIFPTIERVKHNCGGVGSCRFLLSLSDKTWQRLRSFKIFHDAIPHPGDRVGYPMHVKVARRRFQSKTNSSSFGWIYCGSHNFSPAAWGHLMQYSSETNKSWPLANPNLGQRLHICNYELGILFIVPPQDTSKNSGGLESNLDATVLPFVMPAPRYQHSDRPATAQAMREVALLERESFPQSIVVGEIMDEDISEEEEELVDVTDIIPAEKEEERIYAEMLWSQVGSAESR